MGKHLLTLGKIGTSWATMSSDRVNDWERCESEYPSRETCRAWRRLEHRNAEGYRAVVARHIFRARDRLEEILGYPMPTAHQVLLRDIAYRAMPVVIEHNINVGKVSELDILFPVEEFVALYMRNVMKISLEELAELKKEFGEQRVASHLLAYHEAEELKPGHPGLSNEEAA
jgi:hypothetical protein